MALFSLIITAALLSGAVAQEPAAPADASSSAGEFPIEQLQKIFPEDVILTAPAVNNAEESENAARSAYLASRLWAAARNFPAAETAMGKARTALPKDAEIALGAVQLAMESGDYAKALDEAQTLVDQRPTSVDARLALAGAQRMLQLKTGAAVHRQLAIANYEAARALAPKDMRVLLPLGEYYWSDFYRNPDANTRAELAKKVIEIHQAIFDISSPRERLLPLLRMAFAYKDTGQTGEAIQCFKLATQISPYNGDIVSQLGRLYEDAGRADDAIATYRRGLIIDPSNNSLLIQIDTLLAKQPRGALLKFYADLADDFPVNGDIQRLYAQHLARQGELPKAQEVYRKVIELAGGDVESRFALIWILIQRGQSDEAVKELTDVESKFPDKPDVLDDAASALLALGRIDEAERVLRQAVDAAPEADQPLYIRKLARMLSDAGRLDEAVEAIEKARRLRPDDAINYTLLKKFYLDHGRRDEAMIVLGEALKNLPEDQRPDFYSQRAEMFDAADQPELALSDLDSALKINMNAFKRVEFNLFRADVLAQLKRFDEAETILRGLKGAMNDEAALPGSNGAGNKDAFENLRRMRIGYLFEQASQPEKAEAEYRSLIADNPTFIETYVRLSDLLAKSNQPGKAEQVIEDMLRENGNMPDAFLVASGFFSERGRFERALAVLDEALARFTLDDPYAINVRRGALLGDMNRAGEAEAVLKNLVESNPRQLEAYLQLGMLYDSQDRMDEAERIYRQVIAIDPKEPNAYNNLGYMWAAHGIHLDEAKTMVEKAMELEPDVPAYIDSLGWILYQQGDYAGAVRELESAVIGIEKIRENAEVFEHLGDAYAKLNRPADARRAYQQALDLDAARPGVAEKLGKLK